LKIETQPLEDQQTKLIAELDSETLERYKRQAARKISQKTKFPGFRPGKAPYDLVRRMYGDEALQQEAIEIMLDEVYPQILQEANITPSGPGKLEEIIQMDPPKFAFIVPLPPSIVLGEYREIRKEYAPEPITDEQVEQTVRRLQRSFATAEPVERPAEKGDLVSFKMKLCTHSPKKAKTLPYCKIHPTRW
jgi:trigger factor